MENAEGNTPAIVVVKKRQTTSPMWRILKKAKTKFDAQITKDNAMKLKCIDIYMSAETNDAPKFWGEYMKQVERVLDSRKYLAECQTLGCKPENMAEHIVFLGSATVNRVLANGVLNTLGNDFKLYVDRLTPPEADIYRDDIVAFLQTEPEPEPTIEAA
ncbi:hypothetical protein LJC45_01185 [Alistipes sp. OttesenSCG-928-B03]|nr:hypothetical protein [Alistipes sp. OttesenSCG-928-B03]